MRANKFGQCSLLKKARSSHGGELRKKRSGRGARPLAIKQSMHLVLRSTQAVREKSFKRHASKIKMLLEKFAQKHHVRILKSANVGNHLHLHIQLASRQGYRAFIRAVTGAIVLDVGARKLAKNFWDRRPFTRIVQGRADERRLNAYIMANQYEGRGYTRGEARFLTEWSTA